MCDHGFLLFSSKLSLATKSPPPVTRSPFTPPPPLLSNLFNHPHHTPPRKLLYDKFLCGVDVHISSEMNLHNGLTKNSLKDLLKSLFCLPFCAVFVISRYGNENFFASIVTQSPFSARSPLSSPFVEKLIIFFLFFSIWKEFLCLGCGFAQEIISCYVRKHL